MTRTVATRRRISRRWMLGLVGRLGIGAVGIALVGCGDDDDDTPSPAPVDEQPLAQDQAAATQQAPAQEPAPAVSADGSIQVSLTEWEIILGATSAPAGTVTFNVVNDGNQRGVMHELAVIRTDIAPDALPVSGPVVDESGLDVLGRTGRLDHGETDQLTLEMTPGAYILLCNFRPHYSRGQVAGFTVT